MPKNDKPENLKALARRLEGKQDAFFRRWEKFGAQVKASLKDHTDLLAEICRKQSLMDETAGNILLAIRQNEYLQAYYPAQHGFTEGNVVGVHPCKLQKQQNKDSA